MESASSGWSCVKGAVPLVRDKQGTRLGSCSTRMDWVCEILTCLMQRTWPEKNSRSGRSNLHDMPRMVSKSCVRCLSFVQVLCTYHVLPFADVRIITKAACVAFPVLHNNCIAPVHSLKKVRFIVWVIKNCFFVASITVFLEGRKRGDGRAAEPLFDFPRATRKWSGSWPGPGRRIRRAKHAFFLDGVLLVT